MPPSARPPKRRLSASTMMDLPVPVSPVSTLKPGANSISSRSMVAKLVTLRSRSIALFKKRACQVGPSGPLVLVVVLVTPAKEGARCAESVDSRFCENDRATPLNVKQLS